MEQQGLEDNNTYFCPRCKKFVSKNVIHFCDSRKETEMFNNMNVEIQNLDKDTAKKMLKNFGYDRRLDYED